jgi:hypothetical protein
MAYSTPYTLHFENRGQYLYARITAEEIDRPSALEYLNEVADQLRASGLKRLMLERQIPVMLNDADLFHTTLDFLEMIRGTKAAFINPHSSIDDSMAFAMTIGNNRGAMYRLFNDADAGELWLLS